MARRSENEYDALQIGLHASQKALSSVKVIFSDLKDGRGNSISAQRMTCFNTHGIDPAGKAFEIDLNVSRGAVQPLWIGIDIGQGQPPGSYTGSVSIQPARLEPQSVLLNIHVADTVIADRGDSQPWRHSRLRWLNSTAGLDSEAVAP